MDNMINDKNLKGIMNRIKSRRLELNLSYQDLANKTNMSKSTLQRYETGSIKNMPVDKLSIIANALDVDPIWLLGFGSNSTDILSKKETMLLDCFNTLDSDDKNKVIDYSKLLSTQDKYKEEKKIVELPKREKQIWEEPGKEHLMPIASHDDNLSKEEKENMNNIINNFIKDNL